MSQQMAKVNIFAFRETALIKTLMYSTRFVYMFGSLETLSCDRSGHILKITIPKIAMKVWRYKAELPAVL